MGQGKILGHSSKSLAAGAGEGAVIGIVLYRTTVNFD